MRQTPTPEPAQKLVEQARAARTKGDIPEALRLADEALDRQPTSREAVTLKIELTASTGALAGALEAYDRYIKAGGAGDRALLVPIARAELGKLRENDLAEIRATALASLIAGGDAAARKELERTTTAGGSSSSIATDAALSRLGDDRAASRLADHVRQGRLSARLSALDAVKTLESAPSSIERAIIGALEDKESAVRAGAAQAAGDLKIRAALPALRRALADPVPYLVKLSAAVSLRRMGDPAGDGILRQALASDIPEARTFAARAYTITEARLWRPAIEPLLTSATGLDALNAAELLLPLKSAAAQLVLDKAVADPNPSVRARAARVAVRQRDITPALLRRLLGDDAPLVRLYAADGLIQPQLPATLSR